MSFVKITRTAIAGLLIAAVPVTAATAAVRPSSAIPAAGSSAAAAQDGYSGGMSSTGWIALAAVAIIWAIALLGDRDDNDDFEISRG